MEQSAQPESSPPPAKGPIPFVRLTITGFFMGLANLVPGVSGGTMVLALGLYQEFIGAVSDLTRLRFSARSFIVICLLFGLSALTILGLSSLIEFLLEMFKPGMLALFIGMTLGGAPLLHRSIRPMNGGAWVFAALGFGLMALIAFGLQADLRSPGWGLFFLGGLVGSSAMILPGISGSYLLLVLGLYLPIISGVSDLRAALSERDVAQLLSISFSLVLPVGLGLVTGVILLANVLKFFLEKYHNPTTGFLLGLLVGAVLGLYPFQETSLERFPRHAVAPAPDALPGEGELRILGYGWEPGGAAPIDRQLERLESEVLTVRILDAGEDRVSSVADVEAARAASAVMVAYDVRVPRDVRRAAGDRDAGLVPLYIIPDTQFTFPRALLAGVLVLGGFLLTWSLGRMRDPSAKLQSRENG